MYIFSSVSLLTLNLRNLNKSSLVHATVVYKLSPWGGGFRFKDKIIGTILAALKSTSQLAPYISMRFKSPLRIVPAVLGFSTIIYNVVSSANSLTDARSS